MSISRPINEKELLNREATGLFRASRFIRNIASPDNKIDVDVIREIHTCIFKEAWPEIAGQWRREDLEIKKSEHHPPAWQDIPLLMREIDKELQEKIKNLVPIHAHIMGAREITDEESIMMGVIIMEAAWIHHKIAYVHPFRDGNGRTARLVANLILESFGLIGISVKVERENKNRYLFALREIDRTQNYEPLCGIIADGIIERYDGADLRLL